MIRIGASFVVLVLSGIFTVLIAQNNNPFELNHRLKTVQMKGAQDMTPPAISKNGISKSLNPFDIRKNSDHNDHIASNHSERNQVVIHPKAKVINKDGEDFLFWMLILDLLFLSVVINLNRSSLSSIFKALRNDSFMSLLAKTSSTQSRVQFNLYFFLYVINLGLFLYLAQKNLLQIQGISWIIRMIGIVFGIYIVRYLSLRLLAYIYPVKREVDVYRFTIIIFSTFIMFFLIAINFFMAFVPTSWVTPFMYGALVLIVGGYTIRQLRGLFIGINYIRQSPSHFFLYLCTFEIAPIIIGYKLFEMMGVAF